MTTRQIHTRSRSARAFRRIRRTAAVRALAMVALSLALLITGVAGRAGPVAAAVLDGGPGPQGPLQGGGSAAGLGHYTGAPATRSGSGNGQAPGHLKGAAPPLLHPLRQVTPHASGPDLSGPFDPRSAQRHPEMDDDRTEVLEDSAGRVQKQISAGRRNYKDSSGTWQPIDTTWQPSGTRLKQKANDLGADVAASADDPDLTKFSSDAGHFVGEGLVGAAKVAPTFSGSSANYLNVLPNIDLRLQANPSGIEETLILKTATAATSWSYTLDLSGLSPTSDGNGGLLFIDQSGKTVAVMPHGWMMDSNIDPGGYGQTSNAVTYTVATVAGKPTLTVSLDPKWVHDPARKWPIRVDPSTYQNLATQAYSTYVDKANGSTAVDAHTYRSLAIGTWDGNSSDNPKHLASSFIDFTGYGGVPAGKKATSATLSLFLILDDPQCTSSPFEVHLTNANWTVNSPPTPTTNTEVYGTGGPIDPTIQTTFTPTVNAASPECKQTSDLNYDQGSSYNVTLPYSILDQPNNNIDTNASDKTYNQYTDVGLALIGKPSWNGTNSSWKRFDSAVYNNHPPLLTITYSPDVQPQFDEVGTGVTSTLTPELLAFGHDPDSFPSGGTVTYDFQVYATDPTTGAQTGSPLGDSGSQPGGDWTVPASANLAWNTNYVWTATISDGYTAANTALPPEPLILQPPAPIIGSTFGRDVGTKGYDTDTGGFDYADTDASVATVGPALMMRRTYNSLDTVAGNAFGTGWTTELDMNATLAKNAAGTLTGLVITHPDGQRLELPTAANGTFTPPQGQYATITVATGGASGYNYTDKDHTTWAFTHPWSARPGVYGLSSVTDAVGRTLTFTWTGDQITKATTASGRTLTFTWNTPAGAAWPHIASVVTDPVTAGQPNSALSWTYNYNGDQLASACSPIPGNGCAGYTWQSTSHYATTVADSGPSAYWRLGESSVPNAGFVAYDTLTQNNHEFDAGYTSTMVSGSTTSPIVNSSATAADFDGTDAWVSLMSPSQSMALFSGNMSVGMWFKTTTADRVLLGYHDDPLTKATSSASFIPALYVGTDNKLHGQLGWAGTPHPIASSTTVTDGKWHQVVLTSTVTGTYTNGYPLTVDTLYLDGAPNGTGTPTGTVTQNGLNLHPSYVTVGAGFNGSTWPSQGNSGAAKAEFFAGSVCDVGDWARTLSAAEIAAQYAAATGTTSSLLTKITSPAGRTVQAATYNPAALSPTAISYRGYRLPGDHVSVVTDADGGTWTLGTPYNTGSSAGFVGAVRDADPQVYWRMNETAAAQAVDTMNPLNNLGNYDNVVVGKTGPFGAGEATAAQFDGTSSDLSPPPGLDLVDGQSAMSVGMWFRTGGAGVLFGYADHPISAGTAGSLVPALYVGTDGYLHGEFWNGSATPISSGVGGPQGPKKVNDNTWHYAVLSAGAGTQTLYLDGRQVGNQLPGNVVAVTADPYSSVGAGYSNSGWPAQPNSASTVWRFSGPIAEFSFYSAKNNQNGTLSAAQVAAQYLAWQTGVGTLPITNNTVTDPTGKTITDSFDPNNLLQALRHTDTLGNTWTTGYDSNGFGYLSTDPNGHTVTLGNDAQGNMLSRSTCQNQAGNKCSTAYWAYPKPTGSVLDDKPTAYYDPRTATPASGSTVPSDNTYRTTTTYNTWGQPTSITGPPVAGFTGGRTTLTTYTSSSTPAAGGGTAPPGLVASVKTPALALTSWTYYADGDLASVTDPLGKVTSYVYDGLGRLLSSTEVSDTFPTGLTSTHTWDGLSRESTRTAPTTTDAVTGLTHTAKTTIGYDPDSHPQTVSTADLAGHDATRTTTTGYDSFGRPNASTDAVGNTSGSTNGSTTTWAYDLYGNRTSLTTAYGTSIATTYAYLYDSEHHLLSLTLKGWTGDPANPSSPTDLVLNSRAYDPAGRLTTVTDSMGGTDNYTYTENGLTSTITRTDAPPSLTNPYNPGTCVRTNTSTADPTHCQIVETDTWDAANDLLSRVTNNGLSTVTHSPDAAGRDISSTLDPSGVNRTTTWAYDGDDHRTNATLTGGGITQSVDAGFDANGNLLTRTVHDIGMDKKTSWARDQRGLALSMIDPLGNATTPPTPGHQTSYVNDEGRRLVKVIAPAVSTETGVEGAAPSTPNAITSTGYDTFGEVLETQDANNNRTVLTYDGDGRLLTSTAPSYTAPGGGTAIAPVTSIGYDALSRATDLLDPANNHTTQVFDQLGNLATRTAPGGASTHWIHDTKNEALSTTTATLAQRQATWDWMGRPVSTTNIERNPAAAYTTTYAYTGPGPWLSQQVTAASITTGYAYDNAGELSTRTDAAGATNYTYDLTGRQLSVTLPDRTSHLVSYDKSGDATGSIDKDAGGTQVRSTSAGYDLDGRLVSGTDADGHISSWGYDALGALISQVEPVASGQSITTGYAHDVVGNATRFTDGRGTNFLTTYNAWNLPEVRTEPSTVANPNPGDRTWTRTYDAMRRPVMLGAPGGVGQSFGYDGRGNLTSQTGSGAEAATTTRTFGYDLDNRVVSASTPDGNGDAFTWDDRNLPVSTAGQSGTAAFAYDPDGRMATRTDAAGTSRYTWDSEGRLATATDAATGTAQTRGYDAASDLTSIAYGSGGATRAFSYDGVHRVTGDTLKAPGGSTEASIGYGFDAVGNETSKTTTGLAGAAANTYGYDQANRLVSWNNGSTTNYAYDASGNRTGIGGQSQVFDARNRLTSVTGSAGSSNYSWTARGTLAAVSGAVTRTVTADAFDQTVTDTATRAGAAGTQAYTYDGLGRQLSAGPGAGGSGPSNTLVYSGLGNEQAADSSTLYARGPAGNLLGTKAGATAGLTLADRHSDTVGTFTATGTTPAGSVAFDPFGNPTATAGAQSGRSGFQSGWTDPATGQVDMWSRHYDPGTGGFGSRDTTDQSPNPASANANHFAYLGGNPFAGTDPTGHDYVDGYCNDAYSDPSNWCPPAYSDPDPLPVGCTSDSCDAYHAGVGEEPVDLCDQIPIPVGCPGHKSTSTPPSGSRTKTSGSGGTRKGTGSGSGTSGPGKGTGSSSGSGHGKTSVPKPKPPVKPITTGPGAPSSPPVLATPPIDGPVTYTGAPEAPVLSPVGGAGGMPSAGAVDPTGLTAGISTLIAGLLGGQATAPPALYTGTMYIGSDGVPQPTQPDCGLNSVASCGLASYGNSAGDPQSNCSGIEQCGLGILGDIAGIGAIFVPGGEAVDAGAEGLAGAAEAAEATALSRTSAQELLEAQGLSSTLAESYVSSFEGQVSVRETRAGEQFLRYTGNPTSTGSFLSTTQFASPEEAIKGLALQGYGNPATFVQTVTATQPSLILQGEIAGGAEGADQTVIMNPGAFEFGEGQAYP